MTYAPLADRLWTQSAGSSMLRKGALVLLGSLVIAAAAQVNVPMQPVPMTLQTLAVLSVGAALGARLGVAALVLYVLEAAVGLPVLAEMKSGLPTLLGPTGGYILGFVLAAGLVGYLAERGFDRSMPRMMLAMLLGAALIYVPGLLWLSGFVGGFGQAITFGLTPFVLGDIVKAVIAAIAFPAVWKWIGEAR
ncbi:biotin transporter BioY [Aestuariivirga sp.]|uniref:biotin transporter BioY n=1 Tax=Aestuariivirga sp. TaxID=2650926 RepID=UPI0039E27847